MPIGATVIKDAVKDVGEQLGSFLTRSVTSSTEDVIKSSSPLGPHLNDLIKNHYQPEFSKSAQIYEEQHINNLKNLMQSKQLHTVSGTMYDDIAKFRFKKDITKLNESELRVVGMQAGTRQARDIVGAAVFGNSKGRLTAAVQAARQAAGGGTKGDAAAATLANALSVYLHEAPGVRGTPWRLAADVYKPSPYTSPGPGENLMNKIMGFSLTPLIVIPHSLQNVNDFYTTNLKSMAEGLSEFATDKKSLEAWVHRTGLLESETRYLAERQAKGLDTWVGKLLHQPGFSALRKQQMLYSAAVHKHNVMSIAQDFLQTGDAKYDSLLGFYGLSGKDIHANMAAGLGPITDDQLQRAVYRGVDASFFVNRDLQVPYGWNQNIWTRNIFKYKHWSYAQTKLLKDGLLRVHAAEGWWGVGKQLAVIGTVFPIAGELIKMTQHAARGQGFDAKDYQKYSLVTPQRFERMGIPHGYAEAASEYIDAMSHTVGIGIEMSAIRAAQQGSLLHMGVGPVVSNIADLAQYSAQAFRGKGHNLERFAISRFGPMGPFLSNYFLKVSPEEAKLQRKQAVSQRKQTRAFNQQHKNKSIIDTLEGK